MSLWLFHYNFGNHNDRPSSAFRRILQIYFLLQLYIYYLNCCNVIIHQQHDPTQTTTSINFVTAYHVLSYNSILLPSSYHTIHQQQQHVYCHSRCKSMLLLLPRQQQQQSMDDSFHYRTKRKIFGLDDVAPSTTIAALLESSTVFESTTTNSTTSSTATTIDDVSTDTDVSRIESSCSTSVLLENNIDSTNSNTELSSATTTAIRHSTHLSPPMEQKTRTTNTTTTSHQHCDDDTSPSTTTVDQPLPITINNHIVKSGGSGSISKTMIVTILDVENIRGYNGFVYTHDQFLQLVQLYQQQQSSYHTNHHQSCFVLVIDHGSFASSYYYVPEEQQQLLNTGGSQYADNNHRGYAIVFAGPHCKADDTIVHDVLPYMLSLLSSSEQQQRAEEEDEQPQTKQNNILLQVITADRMLQSRCHRAVREYYRSRDTMQPTYVPSFGTTTSMKTTIKEKKKTKNQKKMYDIEISSKTHQKRYVRFEVVSPKILLAELVRLYASIQVEQETTNVDEQIIAQPNQTSSSSSSIDSSRNVQNRSVKRRKLYRSSRILYKKETTEDRIRLAEALRLDIEHGEQQVQYPNNINDNNETLQRQFNTTNDEISPAKAYVIHKNRLRYNHLYSMDAKTRTPPSLTARISPFDLPRAGEMTNDTVQQKMVAPGTLRLVIISDTHGFEEQLSSPLPEADVLLHLGDFAMDTVVVNTSKGGGKSRRNKHDNSQLKNFDAWLSKQSPSSPQQLKIVVRGNHDPKSMAFVQSGATYITQPTTMDIAGFKFAFVPYQSSTKNGLRHKTMIPKTGCDVIVSHVPPYSILDRCQTGKLAGSHTLLKGAQSINGKDGPPILWLCGHIHESRGIVRDAVLGNKFTKSQQDDVTIGRSSCTTIVNAACANVGRANYIEYGPTLLDLCISNNSQHDNKLYNEDATVRSSNSNKMNKKVNVVHMDGQYEFMNSKQPSFFRRVNVEQQGTNNMLLAIDLGLRTGISLFDRTTNGRLIRYDHFEFDTVGELAIGAQKVLLDWENDVNAIHREKNLSKNESQILYQITHIAIEGSDPPLIEAWKLAIQQHFNNHKSQHPDHRGTLPNLLLVSPNEWRTDLLTRFERESGESAKVASRRIAQSIILEQCSPSNDDASDERHGRADTSRFDSSSHQQHQLRQSQPSTVANISTDVAESILLGYHIIRRLGWCSIGFLEEL